MVKNKEIVQQDDTVNYKDNVKKLFLKYKAIIYNGNKQVAIIDIDIKKGYFHYKDYCYNINLEDVIIIKTTNLLSFIFGSKYYIMYNIHNPDPLTMKDCNMIPKYISSSVYNSFIKTNVIRQTNNLSNNNFSELLTPQNILIVLVVGVVVLYFGGFI